MPEPDQFGRAVYEIAVTEDAKLKAAMQKSEQIIRNSTDKMAGDFQRMSTAATRVERPVASAGQVFSAFGAQVSAVGGTVGAVGGKIAGLGGAFAGLGTAIFGLPGVILAATAGFGVLIAHFISAKQKADEAKEAMRGFGDELATSTKTAFGQAIGQARALEDRLTALRKGATKGGAIEAAGILTQRGLGRQEETIVTRIRGIERELNKVDVQLVTVADTFERGRLTALEERLFKSMNLEITSLKRLESVRLLEAEKTERQKRAFADATLKERIAAEKQAAMRIAEDQRKATMALAATPLGRLGGAIQQVRETRQVQEENRRMVGLLKALTFGFGSKFIDEVAAVLGIVKAPVAAEAARMGRPRGGAIELSAFATTGAGRAGGFTAADPAEQLRRRQEKERTDAAKVTAASNVQIQKQLTGAG